MITIRTYGKYETFGFTVIEGDDDNDGEGTGETGEKGRGEGC